MKKWSKIEWAITVAASALFLLLLILFSYSHPHSDDYSYTMFVIHKGFWGANKYIFQNDTGRFLSSSLLYLNPMRFRGMSGYEWYTAGLFLIFVLSLFSFFRVVLANVASVKSICFLFAFVFWGFCSFMPNIHEFCYWLCGEATYLASVSLLFFAAVLHFLLLQERYRDNILLYLLCMLNTIAIAGCSEVGIFLYSLVLFLFGLYRKQLNIPHDWRFYIIATLFFAAVLFVFSAKGNIIRHQVTPFSGKFLLALVGGFYATIFWLGKWMIVLLTLMLLYISIFDGVKINPHWTAFRLFKSRTIFLGSILFFLLCQIIIVWMSGSMPEPRSENILFLFLLLSFLLAIQLMIEEHPDIYDLLKTKTKMNAPLKLFSFLYFVSVFFVLPNNFASAFWDVISGAARRYNEQTVHRYALIKADKESIVGVPAVTSRPKLLYFPALTCNNQIDDNDVPGMALAEYFGKQWIYEYHCNTEVPDNSIKELLKQQRAKFFLNKK